MASLHLVEFAQSHFDRIVGLRAGRIFFDCLARDATPTMFQALYVIDEQAPGVQPMTMPEGTQ